MTKPPHLFKPRVRIDKQPLFLSLGTVAEEIYARTPRKGDTVRVISGFATGLTGEVFWRGLPDSKKVLYPVNNPQEHFLWLLAGVGERLGIHVGDHEEVIWTDIDDCERLPLKPV